MARSPIGPAPPTAIVHSSRSTASPIGWSTRSERAITYLEIYWGDLKGHWVENSCFTIAKAVLAGGVLDFTGIAYITLTNDLGYLDGEFKPPLGSTVNIA